MSGLFRATDRSDLPALSKFLVRTYNVRTYNSAPTDFHFAPRWLDWKYLLPRDGWRGSRSYLFERDGKIVAHGGVCPVALRRPDGQIAKAATILDWAADSAIPGLGVMLYRKLMQMVPTAFVIGGAPVTREIVPRLGFRQVGAAPTYAVWLRPWREFRTRPRTGRSFLRLLHGLARSVPAHTRNNRRWEFVRVREFDDSLETPLNGKRPWTTCQRTIADLNYLLQCPELEIRAFLLKRQGQVGGYFIIGKSDWEARVLEILVDSDEIGDWEGACAAVTNAALLDRGVCRIRILSTIPVLTEALKRNGYWRQYKEPIFLHDPTAALDGAFPVSFQYCDGDTGY